jgi:hypothetical protein
LSGRSGYLQVIGGVDLPLGAGSVVRSRVAAVDDRVAKSLVLVIRRDLGTNAPAETFRGALLHLLKMSQALFGGKLTALAGDTIEALGLHSLLVSVIGVGLTSLDDLKSIGIAGKS